MTRVAVLLCVIGGLAGDERLVGSLQPESRAALLRVLQASGETRAAFIGNLYQQTGGGQFAELLIELEEKEWPRQWMIQALSDR